ncbi:MAG: hypothetical protein AB1716_05520 [Planctomycetota bacterium]
MLLAAILIAAVLAAGAPELGAPWMLGDESIFIAANPEVNPRAAAGSPAPLPARLRTILTQVHDDLYQPLPILGYALEWELTGGDVASFRRTDLLLHALNALLLWVVLTRLLARPAAAAPRIDVSLLAWVLALIWALHPALVAAWASDMGRTHLLSTALALGALLLHLRTLATGQDRWFVMALVLLLLAMLSKVIAGWFLLVGVLEVANHGWRRTLTSWRVYAVALICAFFAGLTIWTSWNYGFAEDASKGLFGDPVSRSALAVWIYFRDLAAPFWLTFWHLPDPRTGWSHPLVWAGLALAAASAWHAARSWRQPASRGITIGWVWCWALLLPVLGLVGAREVAAVDKYLYQPLMGVLLVVGVKLLRSLAARPESAQPRLQRMVVPAGAVLALALLVLSLPEVTRARSTVQRAERVAELFPGDPRGLEGLAAAYSYSGDHALPAIDQERVRPDNQEAHFRRLWHAALVSAAEAPDLPRYFPTPDDRGPFHRRLAHQFLQAADPERSLAQARAAQQIEPEKYATWVRLAQALWACGRLAEAAAAYTEGERRLPDEAPAKIVHYTDFGWLLLFELQRDQEACPKFRAAAQVARDGGPAAGIRLPRRARVGLALCEVRHGKGEIGFELVSEALLENPGDVQAGLVLGEYHLLSHHWEQAAKVYGAIVSDHPTEFAALRGLQEAVMRTGRRDDAVQAWREAVRRQPGSRELHSFLIWSLALAGNPGAPEAAGELLARDGNNPLACMALMLTAVRAGELPEAVDWVRKAAVGQPVPEAREFLRAERALRFLSEEAQELPVEAIAARGVILGTGPPVANDRAQAVALLGRYERENGARYRELARTLISELSDPGPTTSPEKRK